MRLNARTIAADVQSGATSAEAIATDVIARTEAYDQVQPQVWIERSTPEILIEKARAVDARVAAGENLPLAGVPFAVKDNIDVAGVPTTAGCPAFAYVPDRSASVVDRLTAAGALMIGKTNLDQFATGLVGTRSPYGAPACVFNRDYVSGGSSSGSAVAVAAGLVAFALGTDTAGSGRVPAAFNGCIGFKPTKGRWSTAGLVPACRSLDCVTVFTGGTADAALVDHVMAGFDPADPFSRQDQPATLLGPSFRLGVPKDSQLQFFGDKEAEALYRQAVRRLEQMGASLFEIDIASLLEAARLLYSGPWIAERTAAVEDMLKRQPEAFHPIVRSIIQGGLAVSGVDTFRGIYALQEFAREATHVWASTDVLVLPTAPTIYRIQDVLAEPLALNSNLGLYTNFVNLLDMSAIALPAGFRENGTGFGVSLIGPAFADAPLLDLGRRYEEAAPLPPLPALDLKTNPAAVKLAVVGAHLAGMPLHWQLASRDARFVSATRTAAQYRLYAMANSVPPKPALVHSGEAGSAIEVEVYELPVEAFGSFVADVPPPLAIGTVTLEDGSEVKGFVAEPRALHGARDISAFGSWRKYIDGNCT